MPPKIENDTSPSLSEREKRSTRRQARGEEDLDLNPPPPTMATQTQTSGPPMAFHNVPGRIRLPPILPSPMAGVGSQAMPLSASTSPFGSEHSHHHFNPHPYTPSHRPTPYNYFPSQDRPSLSSHIAPISPAGSNPPLRATQPDSVIPQKRHHEVGDSQYG
jgi:hypothetical protein